MSPISAPFAKQQMRAGSRAPIATSSVNPSMNGDEVSDSAANSCAHSGRHQATSEGLEVSEKFIAMVERSALGQAHNRFSAIMVAATLLLSLPLAFAQDTSFGQRLFQDKADCQFCHGVNGDGRGDPRSPGRAANLHETNLNRDQLIEVITCGRPGTEMPHFDKYAYEDTDCYGLKGKNLGSDAAHNPHSTSLTKREIEAVADYIVAKFVGK
jgi:mono/diheme cytochrome c family protein